MQFRKHNVNQLNKYNDVLSDHLCMEHAQEFDKRWDPDKFDWRASWTLAEYHSEHFDKWWNPDKYNWDCSWALAKYCSRYFDKWWNQDRFNWEDNSIELAQYCSDYFDQWWNPDKYNWNSSWVLAQYCSEHFDQWWNPDKYNWKNSSWALAQFCTDYFDKWWDPDKYNWKNSSVELTKYCSQYFTIWWDSDKFDWKNGNSLFKFCLQYIDMWWCVDKFTEEFKLEILQQYNNSLIIDKIHMDFDQFIEILTDPRKFKGSISIDVPEQQIKRNIMKTLLKLLNKYKDNETIERIRILLTFIMMYDVENVKLLVKLLDKDIINKLSLTLF